MAAERDVIVVGASRGGIDALGELLSGLPGDLEAAVAVVLHTHVSSPRALPAILGRRTALQVAYARSGEPFQRGRVYIAPPDRHLTIAAPGVCVLSEAPKANHHRPAADPLFLSVSKVCGPRVIAIVLTGGDGDGTEGAVAVKAAGGLVVVQDPVQADAPGMPTSVVTADHPDYVISLSDMPELLVRLVRGRPVPSPAGVNASA